MKDFQILITGIILSLALIIAVSIGTKNISQKGIYMTGSAEKIVISDTASLMITLNASEPSAKAAYSRIQSQIPVIKKYLISKGIKEADIDIRPSSYWKSYKSYANGMSSDEIAAYNYSQNIKITSTNVDDIKFISTDITNFTMQGFDIYCDMPEYQYSKLADLKVELIEEASKDAKNRANATLNVNGNKTGKILSVRTGVFQITSPDSNNVSDMGIFDSSSKEKKVTAVVNVTFEIL